jgi:hypothetical protein
MFPPVFADTTCLESCPGVEGRGLHQGRLAVAAGKNLLVYTSLDGEFGS